MTTWKNLLNENLSDEEFEKKVTQIKNQIQEKKQRDLVRERKERTRRLIQEGAILESAVPQVKEIPVEELKDFLEQRIKTGQ
ncbi:MAG: DUF3847 domain-containing protein [Eubacterium sp.]|nr:DUF3847 domain-containing protein [Eubacterium sp.]